MKKAWTETTLAVALAWTTLSGLFTLTLLDIVDGPWNVDSGWYLLRAALASEGDRPYLEYATIFPPAMDFIHAIPIGLGIDRYLLAVAIPFAWILANGVVSGMLVRRLGGSLSTSLLAACGFLMLSIENEGNHVTLEHGVVFFTLASLLVVTGNSPLGAARLWWCGLAIALASLSKQNGIVAALPVAALLWERRGEIERRSLVSLVAGFATPFVLLLAYLDFQIARIYSEAIEILVGYAGGGDRAMTFQWELERSAPTAILLLVVPLVGLAATMTGPRRMVVGAALVGAVVEFLPRLVRNYPHYTLNVWPFALLVLILAARTPSSRLVRRATSAVTVLLAAIALLHFYNDAQRWSVPGHLPNTFQPAAEALKKVTGHDDRFRLYTGELIIPFLADRKADAYLDPLTVGDRTQSRRRTEGQRWAAFPGRLQAYEMRVAEVAEVISTADFATDTPAFGALSPDLPAVIVEKGTQPWASPLRNRLQQEGFRVLFDQLGPDRMRITVFDRATRPQQAQPEALAPDVR